MVESARPRAAELRRVIAREPVLNGWRIGRTQRIASGFYKSQALELVKT